MATDDLSLNPPLTPTRVFYSTGRMLGVEDFQADQDYHRGRLARALVQLYGSGTITGLLVQTDGNPDVTQLELQVTPGLAIDRVGRIIDVPRTVCIVLNDWLNAQVQAWQQQQTNPVPGQPAIADPNTAIHDGANLWCDVFASFTPCTRGLTPCFATQDDYDATDAFSANRLLDSFAMQLVLRTDADPLTPADPWRTVATRPAAGATLTAADAANIQSLLMQAAVGPAAASVEYPPGFDPTAVFLARVLIAATPGAAGQGPTWDLTNISINNNARMFLYPAALLARLAGLGSGTDT
ncbi:MAG TPA: hypothetical protein VMG35_24935 [Bryobacteraceae bacterium]|nr:hypothetical protein [Bryobacteraceae bacterium]